ncbi:MAG: hypothetical protein JJ895_07110 [Balneolaceae bacterium]|nr:hypothetical protein [Balneolaceae bacterium]
MKKLSLFVVLLISSGTLFAQNSFGPDRPGFGYSSSTTATGMFGIESGVTFLESESNIGEFFFRAGLTDAFEIQLEAGSLVIPKNGDSKLSTQYLILKHKLYNTNDGSLQVSAMNRTSLPFLNADETEFFTEFYFLADFTLTDDLGVNTNIGFGNYAFSDLDNPTFYFTVNPGYVITPGTSVYLGYSYKDEKFFDSNSYEFGIAHLIHSESQIDLGIVFDDDFNPYLKAGIATRF